MIKRVYIDNFRCFSNFEFKPGRINLLFGANGSGKSSFVDLFDRIVGLVVDGRDVEEVFTENDLTLWDTRAEQRFEIDLEIDGRMFGYSAVLERSSRGMALRSERVTRGSAVLYRYENGEVHLHRADGSEGARFPLRGNRSFLAGIEERPETKDLMVFLKRLGDIQRFKLDPTRMSSLTQEEDLKLRKDGANFASWYRHLSLERAADIPRLFEQLEEAVPGFEALELKGAGKQGRTRDLVVKMRKDANHRYDVDFEAISDGQRALIVLYTLLIDTAAAPQTLLLDEPENYVGLPELQPWLQKLDEALGETGQLFLISHHPEVIDFLAAETPVLFRRAAGGPVRVKMAEFDRESGLKASEQIVRGWIDVD